MRKTIFEIDQYYHLYTRKISKELLFLDNQDYIRFLFLILFFQSPTILNNPGRATNDYLKRKKFGISNKTIEDIITTRSVELVAFSLMPTHPHLLVRELKEGGISNYMHRVLTAYAKYHNAKYKRKGHVFEGPFGSVLVENNQQLLYLSTYIHRQARALEKWKNKENLYPWSSYQDFLIPNRWRELLKPEIIMEQFKNSQEYQNFVKISIAKEKKYSFNVNNL